MSFLIERISMKKYGLILLILAVTVGCRKEKTSWNSAWVLPLVSDTLDLKNLMEDSIIESDGTGYYSLGINRDILDLNLSEYIQIPDTTVVQKYAIAAGSLNIQPGTSFVNNNKDHVFALEDVQLKRARISSGRIGVTIENPIETKTIFTVKLPGVTKNGVQIQKTMIANAGTNANPSSTTEWIDLTGYDINMTGSSGSSYNRLQSTMSVQTDPQGSAVSINNQDSSKVIVQLENLNFDYARGYFGNLVIEDTADFSIDFLKNITSGTLDIPNTNLNFAITNSIKVGARATIHSIKNTNQSGSSVSLSHPQVGVPFSVEQATGSWSNLLSSLRNIQFTSSNSNVEAFIENLGDKQEIAYKIELNPYGNLSASWDEFFPSSRLKVRLTANMPLGFGMNNLTIQDTFALDLSQDKEKSHVTSGELVLAVSNGFPLQSQLKLFLLDENNQLIDEVNSSLPIQSSLLGSYVSSFGVQHAKSEVKFMLPTQTLSEINRVKKVVVRAVMNTPDPVTSVPTTVIIPEKAFFAFKLKANFQFETKF